MIVPEAKSSGRCVLVDADELLRFIKKVEWPGVACAACGELFRDGHNPSCELLELKRQVEQAMDAGAFVLGMWKHDGT